MVKPVTVVSKAIVKDCAKVVMSPVPKAESPGPNGIKVPSKPKIGPNLTKISVFEVSLSKLLSSSSINLLANAFLASLNLTGEARHAALVVQAAVVEVDEFHFGTSLAGTLHSPLQQLRRIAILLSAESTSSRTSTRS